MTIELKSVSYRYLPPGGTIVTALQATDFTVELGEFVAVVGANGSGKSTLANAVEHYLHKQGARTYVLDGDNIRKGLCQDLGFSDEDRTENIRRIGEVSKLMLDAGIIVLTAFISPFIKDRKIVRDLVPTGDFIEILCDAPLEICEERDPKGLYKKARAGQIQEFTGISSPYERPGNPEILLETGAKSIDECIVQLLDYMKKHGVLDKNK